MRACEWNSTNPGRIIFTEFDDESRITAERVICFRDRQTVPTAACDR